AERSRSTEKEQAGSKSAPPAKRLPMRKHRAGAFEFHRPDPFALTLSAAGVKTSHPSRSSRSSISSSVGTWRSLVAYLNGVQGVVGSNPTVPTTDSSKT